MTAAANQSHSINAPLLQLQEVSLRYGDKSKMPFKSIGYDISHRCTQLPARKTLRSIVERRVQCHAAHALAILNECRRQHPR